MLHYWDGLHDGATRLGRILTILTIVTAATVSKARHLARRANSLVSTRVHSDNSTLAIGRQKNGRRCAAFRLCQCILPRRWSSATGYGGGGLRCGGEGKIRPAGACI